MHFTDRAEAGRRLVPSSRPVQPPWPRLPATTSRGRRDRSHSVGGIPGDAVELPRPCGWRRWLGRPARPLALGGPDPIGALSRTHAEIEHQIRRLRRATQDNGDRPEPDDVVELRAGLYGLYAIMQLHNAQEEENAFSLMPSLA